MWHAFFSYVCYLAAGQVQGSVLVHIQEGQVSFGSVQQQSWMQQWKHLLKLRGVMFTMSEGFSLGLLIWHMVKLLPTAPLWPLSAATISAERPEWSTALMSAPCRRTSCSPATSSATAAAWSGVLGSRWHNSHLASTIYEIVFSL